MAPTRSSEFKPTVYKRLTTLTKSRFNTLKTLIEDLRETPDTITNVQKKTLKGYVIEIQRKYSDFEANFSRALSYEEDDAVSDDQLAIDQNELSDLYSNLIATIEDLIGISDESVDGTIPSTITASNLNGNVVARLPKLELPTFIGDYATWTNFINLFNTTIHTNTSLSNIIKFQYLLSVLAGEPLSLVRNLSITDANYDIAYNILTNRYQNDRRLQLLHLNQVLDLPDISGKHIPGIRKFLNKYTENVQALSAMKCDITESNPLLAALLLRKLDLELRKKLESARDGITNKKHTLPTVSDIVEFLNHECDRHEDAMCSITNRVQDLPLTSERYKPVHSRHMGSKTVATSTATDTNHSFKCADCDMTNHQTFACPKFLSRTPHERYKLIKSRQHCISCLRMHDVKTCTSKSTCKVCQKRHNTLLHFPFNKQDNQLHSSTNANSTEYSAGISRGIQENKNLALCSNNSDTFNNEQVMVLLGTLLINVRTGSGNVHTFRALLDSGSMSTLITERAVNLLNVQRHPCNVQIQGINQQVTRTKGQIYATVETLSGVPVVTNHTMVILDKLTGHLPKLPVSREVIQLAQQYELADPNFHSPNRIDVILGAALFPHVFTGNQVELGTNMPHIINTQFGHVVMGTSPCVPSTLSASHCQATTLNVCFHASPLDNLHDIIQRFWIQEEVPVHNKQSYEDTICERLFSETHSRDETGRYTVRLPFKESHPVLGTSRTSAEHRLKAMEITFANNERFASSYREFMSEYITLGHMTESDDPLSTDVHYYLPHHGVLKESSSTTKLRTVFDASCKSSSGISLNDLLMTGTRLQTNIADILIQFRRHHIVICCDIKQMYRQILIHPDDRKYQMILWRSNVDQQIKSYQLNTVTYGVNSSPYLAIRTLHQLARDEGQHFPIASHALLHHTYVDDIITGAESVPAALELQSQLQGLLHQGGFELRKWVSNSEQLTHHLPDSHLETPKFISGSNSPHFSVLGLHWSPTSDTFSYSSHGMKLPDKVTKRTVLGTIAQLYDPCGFITPFIMIAKCFMQLVWTLGLDWDTLLPPDLQAHWNRIIAEIHYLTQLAIPRALNVNSSQKTELHGFCDASERGYAAVIYFRCENSAHEVTTNLILAKSRVAPLKKVTIPRLELCAAHLLSRLTAHVVTLFPGQFATTNIRLWSDSTVTLNWIHTPPYRLKTYVANRVAQIQETTPSELWHHVQSQDNPADCASRGIPITQLLHHPLWWHGPSWLTLPSSDWPSSEFDKIATDQMTEIKPDPLPMLAITPTEDWPILFAYSSWTKLVHVMANVIRFIQNCKSKLHHRNHITTAELRTAKHKVFFAVQQATFQTEFQELSQGNCPSHLRHLNPFLDSHQLIRVGGRLRNSSLTYDAKHPILLPKTHHVTNLLIDFCHLQNLHAGPQLVQSILTQEVWILNARNVIRLRLHKCIICHRHCTRNEVPFMADLPHVRTTPAKPFESTGVDYCGPFSAKTAHLKFIKITKVYLCIFVCMVTKAVHIEVVTDLTTDAFIAALTRFISRRGRCSNIYSDCGTNFVGADAALRKIIQTVIHDPKSQSQIRQVMSNLSIQFHFNPPAAPHHGGLWERAVRSTKHHLIRVMGTMKLTLSELITLTTRIEAMLNSRPLTPMSTDPNDLSVLTPGHFLTGAPLVSLPEVNVTEVPTNRLKYWQIVQQFAQKIWKKWTLEYLHTLQQRNKWINKRPNLKIGDLVLLKTNATPLFWPRARVIDVFPGSDDVVRVVKIQCQDGSYVRPATQLCLLPLNDDQ